MSAHCKQLLTTHYRQANSVVPKMNMSKQLITGAPMVSPTKTFNALSESASAASAKRQRCGVGTPTPYMSTPIANICSFAVSSRSFLRDTMREVCVVNEGINWRPAPSASQSGRR